MIPNPDRGWCRLYQPELRQARRPNPGALVAAAVLAAAEAVARSHARGMSPRTVRLLLALEAASVAALPPDGSRC